MTAGYNPPIVKANIHPNYETVNVSCVCGHSFETRSSAPIGRLDICSECHPFYTGKQKIVDSEGRIEKFRKKFGTRYATRGGKKS